MLEKELEYFNKHKEEYLKTYLGQFVVIKDENFLGSFTTEQEAYEAGLNKVGNVPFLMKCVIADEPIEHIPAYYLGLMSA